MQTNLQKQKPEKKNTVKYLAIQADDKGANKLTNTKILAPHDISVIQIQK